MGLNFNFFCAGKDNNKIPYIDIGSLIISIFTLFFVIYSLNDYKYEKKIDYIVDFTSNFSTSIYEYELYLLNTNAENNIIKTSESGFFPVQKKLYDLSIENSKNFLKLESYLKISDMNLAKANKEEFEKLNKKIFNLGEKMKKEVEYQTNKFNYFSTGVTTEKEELLNEISNFTDGLYIEYQE